MNGCEPNEVPLRTLAPGACFELLVGRRARCGVVVQQLSGSTLVDIGAHEHWCYDAQVVPHPEARCEEWLLKEDKSMSKKNGNTATKAKIRRRVIRFEIGKKEPLPKYLDEKNTAYSALMYRAIKRLGNPTFAEIFDDIKRSVSNKTEGKTPKNTLSVILAKMVKDGTVARSEKKEEAQAASA